MLRNFPRLRNLTLANGDPAQFADGVVVRPFRFHDNPIDDARALELEARRCCATSRPPPTGSG